MIKSCNFQLPQLLSWYSTAFWGWPKPENSENHEFFETHQFSHQFSETHEKFSFLFLIHDTLHVTTPFIRGFEIHGYKICPIFIPLQETFLFIYIRLQYYTSYCASSNSVTWREYTKSVSHMVWQTLSVCHAWCLYLTVADSVWVGPNSSE